MRLVEPDLHPALTTELYTDDATMVNDMNGYGIDSYITLQQWSWVSNFEVLKFTPISNKAPGREGGICVCLIIIYLIQRHLISKIAQ